jgi:hypothetical protein
VRRVEREKVATLRRRRDYLAGILADWQSPKPPHRARAEVSALTWAIRIIEEADRLGVLDDLRDLGVYGLDPVRPSAYSGSRETTPTEGGTLA